MIDVSSTIVAKSDQLNADDMVGGPITVMIMRVVVTDSVEQPVVVHIEGHQPWKPCKTMRRVLVVGWGADASKWVGRYVTLYREAAVKWAGDAVGGIRVSAMSHIPKRIEVSLAVAKGKKSKHLIEVLKPSKAMSLDEFQRACAGAVRLGWTRDQVAALIGGKAADVPEDRRRDLAATLSTAPVVPDETTQPATSAGLSDEEKAEIIARERAEAERV